MNTLKAIWGVLGDAKEQIVSISALIGVFIAVSGLRTWRKELKGKSEYEKAKQILRAVYRVKDAFISVRSPVIYSYEYPKDMRDELGNLKDGSRYDGTIHVYNKRFEVLNKTFVELEDQTLDAQVEWGQQFHNDIVKFRICRGQLLSAIQEYTDSLRPGYRRTAGTEPLFEPMSYLYYVGEDSQHDKLLPLINEAVKLYENRLRPHINPPSFCQRLKQHPAIIFLVETVKRWNEQTKD